MALFKKTLGILGGGQLSMMMTIRARQMGFEVFVLSNSLKDPAATYASQWIQGDMYDEVAIKKVTSKVDFLTFETEFIPYRTIQKGIGRTKVQVFPSLDSLAVLQDRWSQKELMWDYQIPTAEFVKINGKDDVDAAYKVFNGHVVFKRRHGVHDSFDTYIIKNKKDFSLFKRKITNQETQFIAERFIPLKSEKSLIFVRNQSKDIFAYPLLNITHKNQQCYRVWGPDQHPTENKLMTKITEMLDYLDYVGTITFELFEVGSELIVNEVVPRVHNSGHITLDAFTVDQFEMHIRSVLGLSFPDDIQSTQKFLMQNIVGTSVRKPVILDIHGKLHWYNKAENYPQRKLGHINYFGRSLKELNTMADFDMKNVRV